jgi:hypothetical protein
MRTAAFFVDRFLRSSATAGSQIISLALKSFSEITPYAKPRRFFNECHFGFAIGAKVFLPRFHRTIAGNHGHGTEVDASAAFIAELGFQVKGRFHAAILSPSHKGKGFDSQISRAGSNATPTQDAVVVVEWVSHIPDPAPLGNVLNRTGVRGLRNQQFRNVSAQFYDFVRVAPDHHTLFYTKGA